MKYQIDANLVWAYVRRSPFGFTSRRLVSPLFQPFEQPVDSISSVFPLSVSPSRWLALCRHSYRLRSLSTDRGDCDGRRRAWLTTECSFDLPGTVAGRPARASIDPQLCTINRVCCGRTKAVEMAEDVEWNARDKRIWCVNVDSQIRFPFIYYSRRRFAFLSRTLTLRGSRLCFCREIDGQNVWKRTETEHRRQQQPQRRQTKCAALQYTRFYCTAKKAIMSDARQKYKNELNLKQRHWKCIWKAE